MVSSSTQKETDVLIVGAGPVGLSAAIKLAEQGVNFRIVDANKENRKLTKATAVHLRTVELLPEEVGADILENGLKITHAKVYENSGISNPDLLLDVDLRHGGDPDWLFSGMIAHPQWQTEEVLVKHLAKLNVAVERGTRVLDMTQDGDSVRVTIENELGKSEDVFKWVIGCDGAHSITRKLQNIPYPGAIHDSNFVALHASFDGLPEELSKVSYSSLTFHKTPEGRSAGLCFAVQTPDDFPRSFLLVLDINDKESEKFYTGERNKYGRKLLRPITPEEAFEIVDGRWYGKDQVKVVPGSIKWCTMFTINSRQASLYRSGRIFLAGDAAHCHSPLGGQGMNMGIQDAVNLAWKLGQVCSGKSSPDLLDTYHAERYQVDKRILRWVEKGNNTVFSRSPIVSMIRTRARRSLSMMMKLLPLVQFALPVLSMVNYSYSNCSDLSHEHWERPPLWPVPVSRVYPFGGYRRRQNFFRIVSKRVRSGDRLPNLHLPDSTRIYPYSCGWLLILCEGQTEGNRELKRNLLDVDILSRKELHSFGEALKSTTGIIDKVVVYPSSDVGAHEKLGVYGQCLFLVRPDSHVGLRSEPMRYDVVVDYLRNRVKLKSVSNARKCKYKPSPKFDPVPFVVWLSIALGAFGLYSKIKRQ